MSEDVTLFHNEKQKMKEKTEEIQEKIEEKGYGVETIELGVGEIEAIYGDERFVGDGIEELIEKL